MTLLPMLGFWALVLWGLAGPGCRRMVTLHLALLPLGSLAVLPAAMSGGLALTPAPMLGALVFLRCAVTRGGLAGMARLSLSARAGPGSAAASVGAMNTMAAIGGQFG